jgi:hypothetical protein
MAGAVTASAVVVEEATVVVVEEATVVVVVEATAVSAETNPDVDLSGIMGMGQWSYAPATAMPWRVATSLMARHLTVAGPMERPTVERPTAEPNANSRQLLEFRAAYETGNGRSVTVPPLYIYGLTSGRSPLYGSLQTAPQHNIVACRPAHRNLLPSPAKTSAECLLPADRPKS